MTSADRSGAPADERGAIGAVRAYLDALAARDFAAACERLTDAVREDLLAACAEGGSPASDCAEALELMLAHVEAEALAGRLSGVAVGPARLAGESAEVDVPGPESPVRLRREGGDWRIARLRSTASGRLAARLEAIKPL